MNRFMECIEMEEINHVGIDVSAKTLEVAVHRQGKTLAMRTFENTPAGHQQLIKAVTKRGQAAQVVLEATGVYSLGIALALKKHPLTEVMVANPRAMKHFAEAVMQRGKSDTMDTATILEFCMRMKFTPWQAPSETLLVLRGIVRRILQLKEEVIVEKTV